MLAWLKSLKQKFEAATRIDSGSPDSDEESKYRPIEWSLIRRMLKSLVPYKKLYAAGISCGLLTVTLDLLAPQFVQRIIDHSTAYISGKSGETQAQAIRYVCLVVLVWTICYAISIVAQRFQIYFMTKAGENVQFMFRRAMFAHLQLLSMSFYDKTKLGRIISRMTSDINSLREVNVWGIWQVIASLTVFTISILSMIFLADIRLFLSVSWLLVVLYFVNRYYLRKSAHMWQMVREGFTRVSTNLAENITGMRVVTAFNRQDANVEVFNRLQDSNTANNITVARFNGFYQPILQCIGYLGRIIILFYGAFLLTSHRVATVGAVVAAYLYWDWLMNQVLVVGTFYNQLLQAMAGAERVFSLLDMKPEVADLPDAKPLPRIIGEVKFEDVTFGYNPERPVLHGVSFTAQPGQMIALVGSTGSGKSSIISLIARFYQPQQGRILVDGHDIRHVTGESLHKQMGLVLQVNYLFTGTVMENIRYAKPGASEDDVINAAKALGTHDSIMTLKDGYNSEVGERGANMSLGQRQLICFTRAFLADPRIFMLDEATSAIDTGTEILVQESLERLLAGRTTFIVAHRLSTIMRADNILVIDAGRIIEQGTHAQLVEAKGKYNHLYEQFTQHH